MRFGTSKPQRMAGDDPGPRPEVRPAVKRCPACRDWLTRDQFSPDLSHASGVATYCRDCAARRTRERKGSAT